MNRPLWLVLTVLALPGCAATPPAGSDGTVAVETLYASGQCGGLDSSAVAWIADTATWRQRYAEVNSLRMEPPPPPAVDFSRDGVLLIDMGQQASAGYGLTLAGEAATVQGGVLTVPVDWREPRSGYAQAQVMSHPCVLVKAPAGAFNRIRVVDQAGRVRLEGSR